MTEFDEKLNLAMHKCKMREKVKTIDIAKALGITPQTLYNFQSGRTSLNAENTYKLMEYLSLTVELKEKQ